MEQGDLRKRSALTTTVSTAAQESFSMHPPASPYDVDARKGNVDMSHRTARRGGLSFPDVAFAFFLAALVVTGYLWLSKLHFLRLVTLLPTIFSAHTAVQNRRSLSRSIIPFTLVVTVACAQLPSALATALALAMVVIFSWTTAEASSVAPTGSTGGVGFVTAAMAIICMIAVLLTENFLIWVVSATFEPGQNPATEPPPLQDNGQLVLRALVFNGLSKREVVGLRRMWNTQWALVACMAVALFVVQVHRNRTLFGVATRALTTVSIARTIRTVSFLITVLPSQVKNCYSQRFPVVPNEVIPWIMVGLQPRSHGGCNDLIISGHAVITSTLACVATSVADNGTFTIALFCMLTMDFAVEVYEGFHYSCDMWLGMVLVVLIWKVLHPIEGEAESSPGEAFCETRYKFSSLMPSKALVYIPPALVAYIQLSVLPEATANFTIIAFVIAAATIYLVFVRRQTNERLRLFFMHYVQHMALCLMALAFGVYL